MKARGRFEIPLAVAILLVSGWPPGRAGAQTPPASETQPPPSSQPVAVQEQPAAAVEPTPTDESVAATSAPPSPAGDWSALGRLLPEMSGPALTWLAVVVILLLTFQARPLLTIHNLDGLVLAGMCVLLTLRQDTGLLPASTAGHTWQWWSYLLLTVAGGYWLLRGAWLLFSKAVTPAACNVAPGAMLVLVAVGLFVSFAKIGAAPLSPASRDGLTGGTFFAQHGKLPYGDTLGRDTRSPLLYLLHAGAVSATASPAELDWTRVPAEAAWVEGEGLSLSFGPLAARVVNGLLFVATFMGIYVIGRRLHSAALGLTLAVIFSVFPGTVECLPRPEIMLPAALATWSVAFALMPGVGGVLSTLFMFAAGLAWPWAWLGLPILWAHFLLRRWHVLGATLGTLGGVAGSLLGVTWLTAPAIPRGDGALAAAGWHPQYAAQATDDGTLIIEKLDPPADLGGTGGLDARLWRFLTGIESSALQNGSRGPGAGKIEMPNGVDVTAVQYRTIAASGPALQELQRAYRGHIAELPQITRMWVALRTVLEATCFPSAARQLPVTPVWTLWLGGDPSTAAAASVLQRAAQTVCLAVVLIVALLLLLGKRTQRRHLLGGFLVVCSATLLAGECGAVTNLAWLLPAVLAAIAARSPNTRPATSISPRLTRPVGDTGPAPRISVEN